MTQTLARTQTQSVRKPETLTVEQALVTGDLSGLDPDARLNYYMRVCESLGLNPLTKPFDYLSLYDSRTQTSKLILYARKDATDQLRKIHKVSILRLEREQIGDLLVVTATAAMPDGRTDSSIGAVNVNGLKGEALANAMMRAETKAKRRVTLSLCGLGMVDESEVESIPGAFLPDYPDSNHDSVPAPKLGPAGMVVSADERVVQRWMEIATEAEAIGLEVEQIDLPIAHAELVRRGRALLEAISNRQEQLDREDAARIAARAHEAAAVRDEDLDAIEVARQRATEGLR